jgi:hypothetical protein
LLESAPNSVPHAFANSEDLSKVRGLRWIVGFLVAVADSDPNSSAEVNWVVEFGAEI